MTIHTARQSPVMTLHTARGHAGPSRASHSRAGSTSTAQSLSDLYNARHAQESNAPSSSSSSRNAPSTSLADLYNKRHDAEVRKTNTSSSSLADLYNQRYVNEHQEEEDDDSVEEVIPTRHQVVSPRRRVIGRHVASSSRAAPETTLRAISVDGSSDEGTPEPARLMQGENDGLEDEIRDEDNDNLSSAPVRNGRDRSQTRSDSIADLQDSSELVYVRRSSIPRRGALGSSATRLTMDSDDEMDFAGTPEPELPQASGSSIALARPHPSPSKLVVPSSESASLDPESGLSTPPIPPHHRKGKTVLQHLLASTQEEESLNSIIEAESEAESTHVASTSARPTALSRVIGSSDEVVVISSDPSSEEPVQAIGSTISRPTRAEAVSVRSSPEQTPPPMDADAVVRLRSPAKSGVAQQAASGPASERASPLAVQPASKPRDIPSEHDSGLVYDSASEAPVITNFRVAELQAAESSANATESESEGQRSRYPRRARNVTDYNVKRIFERYERNQENQDPAPTPTHAPRPKKAVVTPVVVASPQFFDALRSQKPSKNADAGKTTPSFAEFLISRTKSAASAVESSPSSANSASNRNTGSSTTLTEAQVRDLLRSKTGPQPLCNITVNTEDRSSLFQLKPSTRRWLGIKGSGPLELDSESSDDDGIESPRLLGTGTPIHLKLGSIIPTYRRRERITPAELRDALKPFERAGLIGRPIDATGFESASRRLRLGRAYKLPLPHTLRTLSDMEHQEWVRLEEFLPEVSRMVEEQQALEQGRIMVEVDSSDTVQTQYDHLGRKRVSTLKLATGGQLKVYFNVESAEPVVPEEESQGYEIVKTSSPAKPPAMARLASVRPQSQEVVGEGGCEAKSTRGAESSSATPEPVSAVAEAVVSREPDATPSKVVQAKQAQNVLQGKIAEPGPAAKKSAPAVTTSSKPKPTTSKGTLDLLSYFGSQSSASRPAARTNPTTEPAPASKSVSASTPSSTKPGPASRTNAAHPLSAVRKGKQRALDLDIQAWPSSSLSTESEVEVVIDLMQSRSTTESVGTGKRVRSPPEMAKKVGEAARVKKRVVGLAPGRAERKREQPKAAAGDRLVKPTVVLPTAPSGKRKRPTPALHPPSTPTRASSVRPPTPPSNGGWKGISGWYTSTRDAFSPTPQGNKSDRELAKRQRQVKLDGLLSGKKKRRR